MAADGARLDVNNTVRNTETENAPEALLEGGVRDRIVKTAISKTIRDQIAATRATAAQRGEFINGLAVGVVADWDGEIYKVGVGDGLADRAAASPVTVGGTVFEIGSITKVFTATMLAEKVADGVIDLNDLAQDHVDRFHDTVTLPSFAGPDGPASMKVLHLANYTSGFADRQPPGLTGRNQFEIADLYEYLNALADGAGLTSEPGARYAYVNTCFGVLTGILMHHGRAASYARLLSDFLAKARLAMPNTGVIESNTPSIPGLAKGYTAANALQPNYALSTWPALQGGGAIHATCADMVEWLAYNMGVMESPCNHLLPIAQAPRFREDSRRSTGLGWNIRNLGVRSQPTLLDKNGSTSGFRSYIGFQPNETLGVIVLSNTRSTTRIIDQLGAAILAQLTGKKAAQQAA